MRRFFIVNGLLYTLFLVCIHYICGFCIDRRGFAPYHIRMKAMKLEPCGIGHAVIAFCLGADVRPVASYVF